MLLRNRSQLELSSALREWRDSDEPRLQLLGPALSTTSLKDGTPSRTEFFIEPINQFAAEMDAFSRCVLHKKPVPTPGEMGLKDMRIVLAVIESARRGGVPVKI